MPGVDAAPHLTALSGLLNTALPGVLTGFTGIPLPSLGTTAPLNLVGIEGDGPAGDYVSIFLD